MWIIKLNEGICAHRIFLAAFVGGLSKTTLHVFSRRFVDRGRSYSSFIFWESCHCVFRQFSNSMKGHADHWVRGRLFLMGCPKALCAKNQSIPPTGTGVFKIPFGKPCHFIFLVSKNLSRRFFVEISPYSDILLSWQISETKVNFWHWSHLIFNISQNLIDPFLNFIFVPYPIGYRYAYIYIYI